MAFSRSKPYAWVVFEAHTPQDVDFSGDDANDRLEVTSDFAVPVIGCARFQRQCSCVSDLMLE